MKNIHIHESACIDEPVSIGFGTRIRHFSHISKNAEIGEDCVIGQNVYVAKGVKIGSRVKVHNNVSIYTGCELEDEVFLGPGCVLTNVTNPRRQVNHTMYEKTLFKRGCTIGANATIVSGVTIGSYAFIGAGTVVTKDVPYYALVVGSPARQRGWMSRHGRKLTGADEDGLMVCPESGLRYRLSVVGSQGQLRCLDLHEEEPLPEVFDKEEKMYDKYEENV